VRLPSLSGLFDEPVDTRGLCPGNDAILAGRAAFASINAMNKPMHDSECALLTPRWAAKSRRHRAAFI
jgi:hypothetical protein